MNHILYAEIAETPDKLAQGLMFRKSLPENSGMLFRFDDDRELRFWGKNTYIPLDIAFIGSDMEIKKIAKISPMSRKPVFSDYECSMAIEVNDGFFKSNKIDIGDSIELKRDHLGGCYVTFSKKK